MTHPASQVRHYSAARALGSPTAFARGMVADVVAARQLAWYLLVRNLRAQYRQSLLGYLWIVLQPLATTVVWVGLNSTGAIRLGQTATPYPAWVLVGTMLWQTFVEALNAPLAQLNASKALVTKVNFPREALILAGLGEVVVNTGARLLVAVAVLLAFGVPLPNTVVLAPLGVLVLVMLGTAIGLMLAPVGMLYTDVGRGVGVVTAFWFLATPIVYALPDTGWPARLIWQFNPVAPVLDTTRALLATGAPAHGTGALVVALLVVPGLLAGWALFRVALPHVASRMASK